MRSKIEPMKTVAKMLRRHRSLLLNWFRAKGQLSSGVVEGFNTKAKLTSRKSFGFRTYHAAEIALYHALGALPEPEVHPQILLKSQFLKLACPRRLARTLIGKRRRRNTRPVRRVLCFRNWSIRLISSRHPTNWDNTRSLVHFQQYSVYRFERF